MEEGMNDAILQETIAVLREVKPQPEDSGYAAELRRRMTYRQERQETIMRTGLVALLVLMLGLNSWVLSSNNDDEAGYSLEIAAWYGQNDTDPYTD